MEEILSNENEVGFLPHEVHFVLNAVHRATKALSDANKEYGEAVASSGGDWAFDDPASQVAAVEAHMKEKHLQTMIKPRVSPNVKEQLKQRRMKQKVLKYRLRGR